MLNDLLSFNKIFIERTANVGILPPEVAINAGASGPTLRGSGVKFDIRKDDTYSIYNKFEFDVIIGNGEKGTLGDCWDRYIVRCYEMEESCKIIEQAIDMIPEGNVQEKIPRTIRPPKGEIYVRTETPRGELGYYIISDGTTSPYRVKVRAPAFCNLGLIPYISKGYMIADMVAIIGSLDIVLGEIDR